jgi:hypothetical protein
VAVGSGTGVSVKKMYSGVAVGFSWAACPHPARARVNTNSTQHPTKTFTRPDQARFDFNDITTSPFNIIDIRNLVFA